MNEDYLSQAGYCQYNTPFMTKESEKTVMLATAAAEETVTAVTVAEETLTTASPSMKTVETTHEQQQ